MGRSAPHAIVEYLVLADSAEVVDGKLSVIGGGWDTLLVADISRPVKVVLACGIQIPPGEAERQHTLTVSVDRADGQPLAEPLRHTFRPGQTSQAGFAAHVPFAITWELTFPSYGRYGIAAGVDGRGESQRRVEFSVRPAPGTEPAISEEEENFFDEEMGLVG